MAESQLATPLYDGPSLRLLDLPLELLEQIISYLVPPGIKGDRQIVDAFEEGEQHATLYALHHTSKSFRNLTWSSPRLHPPPNIRRNEFGPAKALKSQFLMRLEERDWYSVPMPAVLLNHAQKNRMEEAEAQRKEKLERGEGEERPVWATRLKPRSYHACFSCLRLRRSHLFATSQVTGRRAKLRDQNSPIPPSALKRHFEQISKRFCIPCMRSTSQHIPNNTIRWVEGWDREAGSTGESNVKAVLGTGFVCQRWTCSRFIKVEIGGKAEDVERGTESSEFLRKTCSRCLEYRRPGGDEQPARGHVMI